MFSHTKINMKKICKLCRLQLDLMASDKSVGLIIFTGQLLIHVITGVELIAIATWMKTAVMELFENMTTKYCASDYRLHIGIQQINFIVE